jgi:hypothetical protein
VNPVAPVRVSLVHNVPYDAFVRRRHVQAAEGAAPQQASAPREPALRRLPPHLPRVRVVCQTARARRKP